MNRFSRIRHHVDMKDVKKRHLEETAAKKLEDKRLKEESEQIKAEYEKHKSNWREELINEAAGMFRVSQDNAPIGRPQLEQMTNSQIAAEIASVSNMLELQRQKFQNENQISRTCTKNNNL